MVYFCADDYGLDDAASMHIQQCVDTGALNRVSVFPNFDRVNLHNIIKNKKIRLALHLNLVEGKCMANPDDIDLIADENGCLKHTFGGLFKLSLLHRKKFEEQVYREIKEQVLFWRSILPEGVPFCIDSHQHTHMIPAIFKALFKIIKDEKINLEHIRIPAEPLLPYIKTPSLYFTYGVINIIKQWLLRFLWFLNRRHIIKDEIHSSYFMGILFSGNMDEKRVSKILPKYIKMSEKNGKDIEVLFHPGYLNKNEIDLKDKNVAFSEFYLSDNRKTEFDAVRKIAERSVF